MREALFFALLAFVGCGLFARIFGRNHVFFGLTVAVPLGILQWTGVAIAMVSLGLPWQRAWWLMGLLGLYHAWMIWRAGTVQALVPALVVAVAVALASHWFMHLGWVQFSFDSVEQITIGRALAQTGFSHEAGTLLASWGVLLPLVQSAGVFLGVDVLTSMQPLLWLSLLGMLVASAWMMLDRGRVSISLAAVAMVATPYLFVFQSAYVHNSLPSAVFLLMFMAGSAVAVRRNQAGWLDLAFLGLLGFTLARTEAPLFAALALVLVASVFEGGPLWPRFRHLTIAYVAAAMVWCLALLALIGTGSDIMTPGRIGILMAVLFATAAMIALPPNRFVGRWRLCSPAIVAVVSLAAVGLGYAWMPAHAMENMIAIESNLLLTGRWGAGWWVVAFAIPILFALDRGRLGRVFVAWVIGFTSLVILLGIMRVPYRLGWGDSANRMFTHLLPTVALWLISMASSREFAARALPVATPAFVPFARQWAIAGCLVAAMAVSVMTIAWQPTLASGDVLVRRADGFCPPDGAGRYTFDVALRSDAPGAYAAACSSGPRSVELEIVGRQRFRWIELQEYAVSEVWTDFGVRISDDGVRWTSIFDYGPENLGGAASRSGPTQWRIAVPTEMPARFVAIDYRASAGQNRLLLRQLTFVKN